MVLAACASLSCAHLVEAAWAVTTQNNLSKFGAGTIAAPTGLTATYVASPSSNSLTWTLPPAAQQGTGQTVSSALDGAAYSNIATLSGVVAADTDSGVTGDTNYCYKVTTTYASWTAPTAARCVATPPRAAIDAGGAASGNYAADTGFVGGSTTSTAAVINTTLVKSPAAPQAVYQSTRLGNFTYTVSGLTANAAYKVRLQEAEITWTAQGQRTFNVKINGTQVMTGYDIFKATGAQNKAIALMFPTTADSTGAVAIQFISVVNNATVCGIEIL
jgi:beta-galactosidase